MYFFFVYAHFFATLEYAAKLHGRTCFCAQCPVLYRRLDHRILYCREGAGLCFVGCGLWVVGQMGAVGSGSAVYTLLVGSNVESVQYDYI